MKYAYYGFGMLLFGSIGLVIIVMLQSITINNDADYYDLKEAMRAAMLESIDYECSRSNEKSDGCGYTLKISEQKFVENFTRRFVTTLGGNAKGYSLDFYDIIESPPKASVVVTGLTDNYGIVSQGESLTITNSLSGILELNHGIESVHGYYSSLDVPEEEWNPDYGSEDVQDQGTSTEGIEIEADDERCSGKDGNASLGCATEDVVIEDEDDEGND